ncbi:hypothetical protein [Bradyrhizobium elkanii]|uniref:Glycosyltransferase RgtA/B/C/D-like domain-containing protein n=1 Tax=Bradyrhizobium elkanii TaxID=29448 RepID=A0ABV4EXG5_BRAEL|nr:hypothetical protein [Bradyrhizobium elkanii]MCP1756874.1 hypothetical protein [Bradyrhizobium elkanii]MCP1982387.1 hypothetical protein [Bradyrhizobium elkanii]MCS3882829.1 hypothetical protein [Bradyrhizobium elkanii]MCS4218114.1 hypothetical protein [Bradyrhizobium elkanii]MCW2195436.1 hypothetical protein [Bradyrhizobium elkanii]
MLSSNHSVQMDSETKLSVATARSDHLRPWLPLIFAATTYLALIIKGNLLVDSDIYWHIVVGQWIIDHRAVPHADPFSFTMPGAPWITSAWLAEVIYFAAFKLAGWPGPAMLAALSASLAIFLLTRLLLKALPNVPVMIMVAAAIAMAAIHTMARPHVLVFPLMVLWANALVEASEQRRAPSLWFLSLITLWANLHGSFTLGLALIGPFALEALWTADKSARVTVAWHWLRFGGLALAAACITPYGPESILVTMRLFQLGPILSKISEWQPLDFGETNAVTVCLIAGAGYALYSGLKLPPIRVAALLAVIWQTLAHVRYVDVFALVAPFFIAGPLGRQLSWPELQHSRKLVQPARTAFVAAIAALVVATGMAMATVQYTLPRVPRDAVERLKELKASRILNDYYFCGYLIFEGIPTFIDSRAELYGSAFLTRYYLAVSLHDVPDFVRLLDEYKIDATLLAPSTRAAGLLDRLPDWERAYADEVAVVHIRRAHPENADARK